MNRALAVLRAAGWGLAVLLATAIGVVSLRYLLGQGDMAPPDLRQNFDFQPAVFILHAVSASVALLVAPWQLLTRLRARRPRLHRALGRIYGLAVLLAALAAFPLAVRSSAGPVAGLGFASLATAWLVCTGQGVLAARAGRIAEHRRWMLRSVALTFAAITLRLYLPIPPLLGWDYVDGYRAIAWACWVPNLLVVELWLAGGGAGRAGVAGAPVRA